MPTSERSSGLNVLALHRCAPLAPGDRVGPYVLVARLGAGGMGEVFLAEHEDLGRRVAVKVMHADHLRNPRMHARFAREARLANRVQHPNVVAVTDQHRLPDGRPWLAMELVSGVDVATHAAAGLTLARFYAIARAIVDALAAAHQAGVVHRDLKPSNILVDGDDRVKLLDFGAAKSCDDVDDRLTQTGQIVATPSYMSPEQATGEPADARSDLYSLGVILWELLVGERPFAGRSFGELVLLHATQAPLPPSRAATRQLDEAIPAALDELVLRLLAKRPEQRFASAAELRAALEAGVRPSRRRRLLAPLLLVPIAAALAATFFRVPSPPSLPPPPLEVVAPPAPLLAVPPLVVSLSPTFAPTIVKATRAPKKHPRPRDGAVNGDELKDPFAP